MIYLDNSATTRIDDDVLEAMMPWMRDNYGNASSAYLMGRQARVAIESAREEIASLIHAHPAELTFTSGGTESNNTAIKSCALDSSLVKRVVCSSIEHHSVLHPVETLHQYGIPTDVLDVGSDGRVVPDTVQRFNSPEVLLCVMHANNETGVIQNISDIRAGAPSALLLCDSVQSFAKIPLNVQEMGCDFASFSAHKIHGPKGIGALYVRKGIDFKAHQHGGGQERNRRAGTEAVALIVGFQVAVRQAVRSMHAVAKHTSGLREQLRSELQKRIPDIRINTPHSHSLPNILNLSLLDADVIDGDSILQLLDLKGVACSNGSACVSGAMQPSHVLMAMGRSQRESSAAIRFSLSKYTTEEEVLKAASILSDIVSDLRSQ